MIDAMKRRGRKVRKKATTTTYKHIYTNERNDRSDHLNIWAYFSGKWELIGIGNTAQKLGIMLPLGKGKWEFWAMRKDKRRTAMLSVVFVVEGKRKRQEIATLPT